MEKFSERVEEKFEKASETSHRILGSSLVIILVLVIVIIWYAMVFTSHESVTDKIRDAFIAVSFLTFFIVQRALNKYNLVINIKLNELVKAHDKASNELINIEQKSSQEIDNLADELHGKDEKGR